MIAVLDFGSQTSHLIKRRLNELGVEASLVEPKDSDKFLQKNKVKGIILSGGPSSVYSKNAPKISKRIFEKDIPVLGICYGLQLTAKLLGGKVLPGRREYGPARLKILNSKSHISKGLKKTSTAWMSHGDEVLEIPKGFEVLGETKDVPYALVANSVRKIYGVQFHPEVEHTEDGQKVLKNFIKICKVTKTKNQIDLTLLKRKIKEIVGESFVIGAISGGVDSTAAGVLTADSIGRKFIPIYVDNGLMREGTESNVKKIFVKHGIKPLVLNVEKEMLSKLKGVDDPERKRKIIGKFYIELFERELKKLQKKGMEINYLLQGTIHSDVIESKGTLLSSKIKSHHNVGGLPKKMKLKLLEPLRDYFKDEVREIGRKLGVSEEFVQKQPFPGPGYAVRIRGEVTRERLKRIKIADKIVLSELDKSGILENVFQSFPVLTGAFSTAVKGDGRFFGEVVAIRIIESKDVMTAKWARIPFDVLQTISSRIVNEVPGISRVVYDITTKPPATMEWE